MKKLLLALAIILTASTIFAFSERTQVGYCMEVSARSAALLDYNSGEFLYAENENKRLPIASMTKIMLLNLVFEGVDGGLIDLNEKITVSKRAQSMGGSQVFLQADKEYVAGDLIKCVIIASANDASVALAERLFGSEDACVAAMNEKAELWGLTNTLFSNCTGLPKPTQYSCAKDVAVMLSKLIAHKRYFDYSKIWLDELTHPDGQKTTLTNTNKLTRQYAGCDGGKTGYTSDAGYCLAATATKGGMRVIGVCIGEEDSTQRFMDVSALFDYAFDNFKQQVILDKDNQVKESVAVTGGKEESVYIEPKDSVFGLYKAGGSPSFTYEYKINEDIIAPIAKGDVLGMAIVYKDGVEYKKVELVASSSVDRQNLFDVIRRVGGKW